MDQAPRRPVVTFGALMLMLGGAINILEGVVGIANPDYFHDAELFASIEAWAWFFACVGLLQFITGVAVLRGSVVALWPGIALAAFNAMTQFIDVAMYPIWSIAAIVVDFIVIYNFAVEGMRVGTEEAERVYR